MTTTTTTVVVDALNVIGSRPDGWWRDRPGAYRRLVERLSSVAAGSEEVTAVLDGPVLAGLPEGNHEGVEVRYARRGGPDAADDRIVELVEDHPHPASVVVVTADRELRRRVTDLGATVEGPRALLERLEPR